MAWATPHSVHQIANRDAIDDLRWPVVNAAGPVLAQGSGQTQAALVMRGVAGSKAPALGLLAPEYCRSECCSKVRCPNTRLGSGLHESQHGRKVGSAAGFQGGESCRNRALPPAPHSSFTLPRDDDGRVDGQIQVVASIRGEAPGVVHYPAEALRRRDGSSRGATDHAPRPLRAS